MENVETVLSFYGIFFSQLGLSLKDVSEWVTFIQQLLCDKLAKPLPAQGFGHQNLSMNLIHAYSIQL